MSTPFHQLFSVVRFTPGRRMRVFRQMLALAVKRNLTELVTHLQRALGNDTLARLLKDRRRKKGQRNAYASVLKALDPITDKTVTSIRDQAKAAASGWPANHPIVTQVEEFLAAVFPNGVAAITSLPFTEQAVALQNLMKVLLGDQAERVTTLKLDDKVAYLAELTSQYVTAVDLDNDKVKTADVEARDDRGHLYMLEVLGMILGTFHDSDNPAHVAARDELLAPFFEQLAVSRALWRAKRYGNGDAVVEEDDDIDDSSETPDAPVIPDAPASPDAGEVLGSSPSVPVNAQPASVAEKRPRSRRKRAEGKATRAPKRSSRAASNPNTTV